jgi:hypothetical protein
MTVAVTLFALLELYKRGEADWEQQETFGEIAVRAGSPSPQASPHPEGHTPFGAHGTLNGTDRLAMAGGAAGPGGLAG